MISILCPSRGRPELARKLYDSLKQNTSGDFELLFYCNVDDEQVVKYSQYLPNGSSNCRIFYGHDQPTGFSWQFLAEKASGRILILMGDDAEFITPDWDTKLLTEYGKLPADKIAVFSFQDGRGEVGLSHPHPAVTREWMNALGYFVPPQFLHWYLDTWLVELAQSVQRFFYVKDILVRHTKPSDHGKPDETHNRIRRSNWNARDKMVYEKLKEIGLMRLEASKLLELIK